MDAFDDTGVHNQSFLQRDLLLQQVNNRILGAVTKVKVKNENEIATMHIEVIVFVSVKTMEDYVQVEVVLQDI